jgi:hypothetical protein
VPLWTAAEAGGEANFGVVVVFSSPLVDVGVDALDELELLVELFEEPQPPASSSAAEQAINIGRPPLIAFGP